jgi:hypothetical protein
MERATGIETGDVQLGKLGRRETLKRPVTRVVPAVSCRMSTQVSFAKTAPDSVDDVPCSRDSQERQETVGS